MNSTEKGEVRKFGAVALVFFGTLCGLGIWSGRAVPTYLFGLLSLLGLGFILFPAPLAPFHRGWLRVAHLIGKTLTMLILALAYYLVITPSALVKRLIGGGPSPSGPIKARCPTGLRGMNRPSPPSGSTSGIR